MSLNFFQWLAKRVPYGIALFLVFISWGVVTALFFGGPIVISHFDFEATGIKNLFWFNLLGSVILVVIYAQLKFGFYRKLGCKFLEMKEARIFNEYIVKGHIPPYISDQNLLELTFALRNIIARTLRLNFGFVIFVITWVVTVEYFVSGGQFRNIPSILAGGIISGISCYMLVSLSCELCTAQIRKECRKLLNQRKIKQEEAQLYSLKNRIILFPILIILIEVTILIVAYPFDSTLLLTSLVGLIAMIMLSNLILSSFYIPILEIKNSAEKMRKGGKVSFFSGSSIREIMDLSKSFYDASEKLEESKTVLKIKVKARTRELDELSKSLEVQVKERTKKIENSQKALMNILDDYKIEKETSQTEKNKTVAIIKNMSDGILIFNKNNVLTTVNKMAIKLLALKNVKETDYKRKSTDELTQLKSFKPIIDITGLKIKDIFRKELDIKDTDSNIEISTTPILINKKQIGKFIVLHDITREKKVQALKTEFVSIAAHQLRTPLSAIKWTLTALIDGDFEDLNEKQLLYIKKANTSNERMIDLVNDLLNLSRIEAGKYIQIKNFLNIEELISEVIQDEEIKAKRKNVILKFNKKKNISELYVDKEKITLLIQNLTENALNYCYADTTIYISLKEDKSNHELQFSITNSGIGIPKESQERIFTKFFRADNAVKTETVGSGLGLYINKNIVEAHGGKIWFESEEKKDTIFSFTLPIKDKVEEF